MTEADSPDETRYDRRAFALAYLEAHASDSDAMGGYYAEKSAYNAALRAHRQQLLAGLQELFGLTLERSALPPGFTNEVLFMLFNSTVRSFLALTTPWSGVLEAGLLERKLDESGPPGLVVREASDRIRDLTEQCRQAHLDILEALIAVFLGERAEQVFTSADLQAIGVDDTPPRDLDYPWDFDER